MGTMRGPTAATGMRIRPAEMLSALIAVLIVAASIAGLAVDGLYRDPAPLVATFRAYDLVLLLVGVPVIALTLGGSRRRSPRMQLVRLGALAYTAYTYALCVFGASFNDVFLLHVALLSLSVVALVMGWADLDVEQVAVRFGPRTPVRSIAVVLAFLALGLGGMWILYSLRFAATGELPRESLLVSSLASKHLAYALDLAFLVPGYALAAVLLWRRRPSGYVLATVLLVSGAILQFSYMAALVFQARAGVAGAVSFDPAEPPIAAAFLIAAVLLLRNLRDPRADPVDRATRPAAADEPDTSDRSDGRVPSLTGPPSAPRRHGR